MFHNYTEEIAWLRRKLEQNPNSMLYARLAERYIQMNEIDTAEKIVKNRLSSQKGYSTPHLILAKCYLKANRFDEADQEIKKALQIEPNSLLAYKMQCDLKERIGLNAEVRSGYEKIFALDPLDAETKQFLDLTKSSQEEPFAPLMDAEFDQEDDVETVTAESLYEPEPVVESEADFLDVIDEETSELHAESRFGDMAEEELTGFEDTDEKVIEEPEFDKDELESFFKSEAAQETDIEEKAAQLEEELLLDSDEEMYETDTEEESFLADEEDMFVESLDSLSAKTVGPRFETKAINEDAILPDIESDLEPSLDSDDIDDEETRFSEILDDIFAPTVDDEVRREEETRSTLEKLADDSKDIDVENVDAAPAAKPAAEQPLVDEPETFVDEEMEQEAIDAADSFDDDPDFLRDDLAEFKKVEPEQDAFEEFNPFDDFQDETAEDTDDKFEDAEFEPIELDDEQEAEEQFVDFLSSVDRDEPSIPATIERDELLEEDVEPELKPEPEPQKRPVSSSRSSADIERPKEKFVTPTLGEIYAAQGQYAKAINVFELLLEKNPDNEWYRSKLDDLKEKLEQQKDK